MTTPSAPPACYGDLRAVFVNCTLKPSPEPSHTQLLLDESAAIMAAQGVSVDTIRAEDHILVIGTPIWLGERSSTCSRVIERLYAQSADLNAEGQYASTSAVPGTPGRASITRTPNTADAARVRMRGRRDRGCERGPGPEARAFGPGSSC